MVTQTCYRKNVYPVDSFTSFFLARMTATPKWFARYKDDIEIIFSKIQILQVEFKNLTTKFLLETQKTIICDYVSLFVPDFPANLISFFISQDLKNLINDCQNAFQLYDEIRILTEEDDGKSTIDNIQRTIYTTVLKRKYKIMSDNLYRFSCQLLLTIQKFVSNLSYSKVERTNNRFPLAH